jgi:hypothetical protein
MPFGVEGSISGLIGGLAAVLVIAFIWRRPLRRCLDGGAGPIAASLVRGVAWLVTGGVAYVVGLAVISELISAGVWPPGRYPRLVVVAPFGLVLGAVIGVAALVRSRRG